MDLARLRTLVAAEYGRLNPPSWPNPHEHQDASRDEYSRFTDPQRLHIVFTRACVWAQVLSGQPGLEVETVGAGALGDQFDRGLCLVPDRAGTLPLLLLLQHQRVEPTLVVSLARPEVVLEQIPDCGCDGCDFGSDNLLMAVDDTVAEAMGGIVAFRGKGWSAHWSPDGGNLNGKPGTPDFDEVMSWGRLLAAGEPVALPDGARAGVSRPWDGE